MEEEKFPCLNCGTEITKKERQQTNEANWLYDCCIYCEKSAPCSENEVFIKKYNNKK